MVAPIDASLVLWAVNSPSPLLVGLGDGADVAVGVEEEDDVASDDAAPAAGTATTVLPIVAPAAGVEIDSAPGAGVAVGTGAGSGALQAAVSANARVSTKNVVVVFMSERIDSPVSEAAAFLASGRPSITVAHAVEVPESVSCNDTAWPGPDAAVSSLTNGWSGWDCHGAATAAGIAVV